jgi:hypothetical protein
MKQFNGDHPKDHWPVELINVKDKVVLDLGCGNDGNLSTLDWPPTPEHFIANGAKKVIGIEINSLDLEYLNNKIDSSKGFFTTPSKNVSDLIKEHNVQVIKCDNEGGETELFSLPTETFRLVEEYYVETHNDSLNQWAKAKFAECGYDILEELEFAPLPGLIRVLFARRREN